MKVMLIATERGLIGSTPKDDEEWLKFKRRQQTIKAGEWLRVEWSSPRNGKHHRKMFALLTLVAENSETYSTTAKALNAVKLAAAYFDPFIDPRTGEIIPLVKSISFDAMPQEEFDVFYSAAIDGVLQVILPTMSRETADNLLDMIITGWA